MFHPLSNEDLDRFTMHRFIMVFLFFFTFFLSNASFSEAGQKKRWWINDIALSGVVGSFGNMPVAGIRGTFPMGHRLALRLGWHMQFDSLDDVPLGFSRISLDLLIRLPSPLNSVRYYAVTRLECWPLWDAFGVNPGLRSISTKPTLGLSVLLGVESFLMKGFSLLLETGFSSGMLIGFAPIASKYKAFGFAIQVGMQLYF